MMAEKFILEAFLNSGKIVTFGNGGSMADAMHMAAELEKKFQTSRPLPENFIELLKNVPLGSTLISNLEVGFPVRVLGLNAALTTAIENDFIERDMAFAQEAYSILTPSDVVVCFSTSGNSRNCRLAVSVAKAMGCRIILITGPDGGEISKISDVTINCKGDSVAEIQNEHRIVYHKICADIEEFFFGNPKH